MILQVFLGSIVGLVLLYLATRIISAAWFRSKRDHIVSMYKQIKEKED